ncbi:flagellar hook-associated protein FlgK [Fontivita pretiosa]|uniref:flagellar hook-associated protein FlgK n=1 Tax=Fontivita pretiosa TaxID=2989684 RepID=UPI003D163B21
MSLIGALNIGKTALAVTQAQIQTTGNNISNAGNADYTRQVARATPNKDLLAGPGIFLGTGINLQSVQRQIDEALEGRIRGSVSDDESANVMQQWLGRIESLFNELSDQDLSTQLSTFFNSWSNLANKPQDIGLRQVVIQNGSNLAQSFKDLRAQLGSLQSDVDQRTEALVNNANALADQIAQLNAQIIQAEGGSGGTANALRDQRDAVLKQLAELIDIKTVLQDNGVMDVYVGSEPLVTGDINRGVGMRRQSVDGELETAVIFRQSDGAMKLSAGQLGALGQVRSTIGEVLDQVDSLAASLIFELNRIHSSGQGLEGMTTVVADNIVEDTSAALNSQAAGLKFTATTGSFVVHVRNRITGLSSSTLIQVDLDGLNGNDTTLQSLQADLDAIGNISASISGGRLSISADSSDVQISFSQDSSGVLAALGINSFFSGSDAGNIAVNQTIAAKPALLAAAQNGERGDNQTALAIAGLESQGLSSLGGASIKQNYEAMVNGIATSAAAARTSAEATATIRQTLAAQREALSGVSLDEEAVNLMKQQRAFQGAAKLISAVNELMQTLLNMA